MDRRFSSPPTSPTASGTKPSSRTDDLWRQHQAQMAEFEALLRKKGLSMDDLEAFSEKYLEKHPKLAGEVNRRIEDQIAACKATKRPIAPIPAAMRIQPSHWVRA
jgi:hypothetical protein